MDKKLNFNNTENDQSILNNEEIDYKNLLIRLQQISKTIALLEKIYS